MIEQKQKDIADIRETMQICKNEYEDYFHRFDVIKRQAVTKENWDKIQKNYKNWRKKKKTFSRIYNRQEIQSKA